MKSKKRKNNLLILLMLILFISVGYAMLTTTININGTGKVKNAKWDVHFANIQVTDGSVTPTTAANITADTSAEFAVTLEKPGDFYEFTIDVVNAGTIDAMIDTFSKTPETVPDCVNYTVTWANGETPKAKDGLAKGKTYQMRVRVEMLKDITADQLLTAEETLTLAVQLDCVQATDEAEYAVPSVSVTYYAFGDPLTAEDRTTDYTTLNSKVFVKLDEAGQKSVCTLVTGNLECFKNNNVTEEQEHLKQVFGESNCTNPYDGETDCRKYSQDPDINDVGYCILSNTSVHCRDQVKSYSCHLYATGEVYCDHTP